MKRVFIESPFSGERERNLEYAGRAILDCLGRGEAPIATHFLYGQLIKDGTDWWTAGWEWFELCDAVVVYEDYGISAGMQAGIDRALSEGKPVEYRCLNDEPKE